VDPVSLVLNALSAGAAQGIADSVSNAVKSAYGKLKQLVSAKLSGNNAGEVAPGRAAGQAPRRLRGACLKVGPARPARAQMRQFCAHGSLRRNVV
jgi:hypothetical protein